MQINMVQTSQTLTTFHFLEIADRYLKVIQSLTELRKMEVLGYFPLLTHYAP